VTAESDVREGSGKELKVLEDVILALPPILHSVMQGVTYLYACLILTFGIFSPEVDCVDKFPLDYSAVALRLSRLNVFLGLDEI
jgi:hypothetical protein